MNRLVILFLAIDAISSAPQVYVDAPDDSDPLSSVFGGLFDTLGTAGHSIVDVAQTGAEDVEGVGRNILNRGNKLASRALQGATDTLGKAVDTGVKLTGVVKIPGLSALAKTTGKGLKTGLSLSNMAGQTALREGDTFVNRTEDQLQDMTGRAGAYGHEAVDISHDMSSLAADTGINVIKHGTSALPETDQSLDSADSWAKFVAELNAINKLPHARQNTMRVERVYTNTRPDYEN